MPLRMIEIILPERLNYKLRDLLEQHPFIDVWYEKLHEDKGILVKGLLQVEETENLLSSISNQVDGGDDIRIVLHAVEATLPRPATEEEEPQEERELAPLRIRRVSSEELYEDLKGGSRLSWISVIMTGLSAMVASIGITYDNVPVVIGAMVIAPLLAPNVALSLATTLGDLLLGLQSAVNLGAGILCALSVSFLFGLLVPMPENLAYVEQLVPMGYKDLALALCAGMAGTLAFTSATVPAMVGVMVAVALLPSLVATGMLLGSGDLPEAGRMGLIFLSNLICINLAGVVIFLLQGIHPLNWFETAAARRTTFIAIAVWSTLLTLLVLIIIFS